MLVDEGPLVLVETRKDLSQIKLPFETRRAARSLTEPTHSAARLTPGGVMGAARLRVRAGARARAGRPAWCISSSQVSGAVCGSRSRRRASLSGSGCQRPVRLRRQQAVEQRVDGRAAVERLVAQQHQVAAGVQRDARRFGVAELGAVDAGARLPC